MSRVMGLKHNLKRIKESFKTTESKIYHHYNNGLTISLTTKHATTTSIATAQTGIYTEPTEYSQSTHLQHTGVNMTKHNEESKR